MSISGLPLADAKEWPPGFGCGRRRVEGQELRAPLTAHPHSAIIIVYSRQNGAASMLKRATKAVERSIRVEIRVDGRRISAFAGESLAVALAAEGILHLRASPRAGTPRGMFCMMGVCQECVVRVDGRAVNACQEPVRDGMTVISGTLK